MQRQNTEKERYDHFLSTVKIHRHGKLKAGNTIKFTVSCEDSEENSDDLFREWKVFKNGQIIKKSNKVELQLELEKGKYKIEIQLGGYWRKTQVIEAL